MRITNLVLPQLRRPASGAVRIHMTAPRRLVRLLQQRQLPPMKLNLLLVCGPVRWRSYLLSQLVFQQVLVQPRLYDLLVVLQPIRHAGILRPQLLIGLDRLVLRLQPLLYPRAHRSFSCSFHVPMRLWTASPGCLRSPDLPIFRSSTLPISRSSNSFSAYSFPPCQRFCFFRFGSPKETKSGMKACLSSCRSKFRDVCAAPERTF